jgi:hypothetical protein
MVDIMRLIFHELAGGGYSLAGAVGFHSERIGKPRGTVDQGVLAGWPVVVGGLKSGPQPDRGANSTSSK